MYCYTIRIDNYQEMKGGYQHYLGIDLHRRCSYLVLMDVGGKVIAQRCLPNVLAVAVVAQADSALAG